MTSWFGEFRQAWRGALRRPAFLVLAVATLALGVGASVAVVSLVDRVLLRPLPYPAPGELFAAGLVHDSGFSSITPQEYRHIEGLDGIASAGIVSMQPMPVNLSEADEPELVQAYWADAGFLATLAAPMHLGRNFVAEEDVPGGASAAIISWQLWQRRFNGDPEVIGRTMSIEGSATPIVGVLPRNARFFEPADLIVPAAIPANSGDDGRNYLSVLRLREPAGAGALSAQVDQRIRTLYAGTGAERFYLTTRFGLAPLSSVYTVQSRAVLILFLASALCVLLLAAVNLANLMLLRAVGRSHVAAIRSTLGASRLRLAMPMLAEGALVALLGVVAGLAIAKVGLWLVGGRIPPAWFGGEMELSPGPFAYGFAFVAGVAVALLAAALGVWRGRSRDGTRELVTGGRGGLTRRAGRLTRALVVAQVALAALLLSGAGLFTRALQQADQVDLGYSTEGLIGFEIVPVRARYPGGAELKQLAQRVVERLETVPGVAMAAAGTNLPIGAPLNYPIQVPGGESTSVELRGVSPGFLDSFDIPVLAGRDIAEGDVADSAPVVLVNQAFVRQHLGLTEAGPAALAQVLGGSVAMPVFGSDEIQTLQIVGVVGDTRQHGPEQAAPAMVYLPLAQVPDGLLALLREYAPLRFAARVAGQPMAFEQAVRSALAEVAPGQPLANVQPVSALVRESTQGTRLNRLLVGVFASLALVLSAVGLYAVIAVATASRQREFGVRAALGSSRGGLLSLVLGDGLRQALLGLALGAVAALASARIVQGFLPGTSAYDPLVLTTVAVLLVAVALAACLIPAIRASRVPPMTALRGE